MSDLKKFEMKYFSSYQSSERKISTFDLGLHEMQTKEILSRLHEAYCCRKEIDENFTASSSFLCCIWMYNYCDNNFNLHFYSTWRSFGVDSTKRCIFAAENGNFIRFFRIFRRFGDVKLQLVTTKLAPVVRFRALLTMSKAYSSRQSVMPMHVIKDWLDYSSLEDVKACCLDMKLEVPFFAYFIV